MKRNVVKAKLSKRLKKSTRLMNFWLSQDKDDLKKVFWIKEKLAVKGQFFYFIKEANISFFLWKYDLDTPTY